MSRFYKYSPLSDFFSNNNEEAITLSYEQIENILGSPLPNSAYQYQAWWTNNPKNHFHASTWVDNGFKVEDIKFGEFIVFRKVKHELINAPSMTTITKEISDIGSSEVLEIEEWRFLEKLSVKLNDTRNFLNASPTPVYEKSASEYLEYMKKLKNILGNISNDASFLGCLLIKEFLLKNYPFQNLNIALKPQGASGLDIDEVTLDGKRIIGELKTTNPYSCNDFGAAQKASFQKDFDKLEKNSADQKYMFVTEKRAFEILNLRYKNDLIGKTLVLLPEAISNQKYIQEY